MSEENSSRAARPSWIRNLVGHRWGDQAPAPTHLGPAGSYVQRQVQERLSDPQWANEARQPRADDAAKPMPSALDNRSSFPLDGPVGPAANRRPYPA